MGFVRKVISLVNMGEYMAAGRLLDQELSKNKENAELWYLRGITSFKAKNYPFSLECLENAIQIKKDFEFLRAKALVYFEMFEFEEALTEFENALKIKNDSEIHFYIALCYMFLDDPRSKDHLETAYLRNRTRTKQLLHSFYNSVFEKSWELNEKQKKELKKLIENID